MSNNRFSAEREHGSDWKVVDNQKGNIALATGLDQEEAETLANLWNTRQQKEKNNFVDNA
jgi:hypothetical protein